MGFLDNVLDRFGSGRSNNGRNAGRGRERDTSEGQYYGDQDYEDDQNFDPRYAEDRYDGRGDGYGYDDGYSDLDDAGSVRPQAMNRFGVDRADYYNDNHSPLVSLSDVRSRPVSFSTASGAGLGASAGAGGAAGAGQDNDRVSAYSALPRSASRSVSSGALVSANSLGSANALGTANPYDQGYSANSLSPLPPHYGDDSAFKDGLARSNNSLAELQEQRMYMESNGAANPYRDAYADVPHSTDDGGGAYASGAYASGMHTGGSGGAYASDAYASNGAGANYNGNGAGASYNDSRSAERHGRQASFGYANIQRSGSLQHGYTLGIDQSQAALGATLDLQDRIAVGQVHRRSTRPMEFIEPDTYAEAERVSIELKNGMVVVLDLRRARPELAKRILDFSFGVACALGGQVERHIDRIYVFTVNGALTQDEQEAISMQVSK